MNDAPQPLDQSREKPGSAAAGPVESPPSGAANPDVADMSTIDVDEMTTEGGYLPQGGITPAAPDQADGVRTTPSAPVDAGSFSDGRTSTGVSSSEVADTKEPADQPAQRPGTAGR